jgi:hypothetical protein
VEDRVGNVEGGLPITEDHTPGSWETRCPQHCVRVSGQLKGTPGMRKTSNHRPQRSVYCPWHLSSARSTMSGLPAGWETDAKPVILSMYWQMHFKRSTSGEGQGLSALGGLLLLVLCPTATCPSLLCLPHKAEQGKTLHTRHQTFQGIWGQREHRVPNQNVLVISMTSLREL